jgi:D-alanyl-D-alanine carboxypeptidase
VRPDQPTGPRTLLRSPRSIVCRTLMWTAIGCAAMALTAMRASAEALLVIEAESGKVLHAANAAYPWHPASVTKVMTAYAVLRAVKEGRLTLETALPVSQAAADQQPVKMGFPPGTLVTVDNALKMLMVRSSNDMAVVLAEGVSGSIEIFADTMNRHAHRLGMTQSTFVNPNGLPADDQISSARDIAILARALIREFPEYDYYWHIPAIKMGKAVQHNYNTLIGRYPGADGMKTGFICASGFNLVASATRDGQRLIAVVLGAPSSQARAVKAAQLLERGFNTSGGLSWLMPSLGTVETMRPINAAPLNLRDEMCSPHRKRGLLREPRLCVVGRWPRCHLWNDRLLQHLAPTRHFLGTQDRPVQCAERAPDYEGGEQPRKFVVIGHDAGLVGSSQARNLHY